MTRDVKKIFIGAMRADAVVDLPLFKTSGKVVINRRPQRYDFRRLETDTAAVVLTNNILPTSCSFQKRKGKMSPCSRRGRHYQVAKQVDDLHAFDTKRYGQNKASGEAVKERVSWTGLQENKREGLNFQKRVLCFCRGDRPTAFLCWN